MSRSPEAVPHHHRGFFHKQLEAGITGRSTVQEPMPQAATPFAVAENGHTQTGKNGNRVPLPNEPRASLLPKPAQPTPADRSATVFNRSERHKDTRGGKENQAAKYVIPGVIAAGILGLVAIEASRDWKEVKDVKKWTEKSAIPTINKGIVKGRELLRSRKTGIHSGTHETVASQRGAAVAPAPVSLIPDTHRPETTFVPEPDSLTEPPSQTPQQTTNAGAKPLPDRAESQTIAIPDKQSGGRVLQKTLQKFADGVANGVKALDQKTRQRKEAWSAISRWPLFHIPAKELAHPTNGATSSESARDVFKRPPLLPSNEQANIGADSSHEALPAALDEKNVAVAVGVREDQGERDTMEDTFINLPEFGSRADQALFAVFDGHGGKDVAEFAQSIFPKALEIELEKSIPANEALQNTYVSIQKQIEEKNLNDGSTAVTAFLRGNTLYLASMGDSRAVLIHDSTAIQLTTDHLLNNEDERKKVEVRGATLSGGYNGDKKPRIAGNGEDNLVWLPVSRAFGDIAFPGMLHEPEITTQKLTPQDKWLLLTSDGLFESGVLTNQEAADIIKDIDDPDKANELLLDAARNPGKYHLKKPDGSDRTPSGDNIIILAIKLSLLASE